MTQAELEDIIHRYEWREKSECDIKRIISDEIEECDEGTEDSAHSDELSVDSGSEYEINTSSDISDEEEETTCRRKLCIEKIVTNGLKLLSFQGTEERYKKILCWEYQGRNQLLQQHKMK